MSSSSGSARKTVTALFCDVTGSTALGEQLDPESLREVIQGYFAEMRTVIERHGGTIEKFIGDAVMAVFGVPRVHEDDALRAVRAAAEMQSALTDANERFERDFGVRIQARVGVNTGEVIAADPNAEGSSFVSGDAVNVAARIEQAAEPGEVLLGETTYRLVRAAVIAQPIDPVAAKGKSEPLNVYRLVVVDPGGEMLPRRLDAPLVGRSDELDALMRTLDDVRKTRSSRLVTVLGDAGIGKSRLIHELVAVACDTARVLRGRCLPYGDGITFWPVAEILEDAAGIETGDSPADARAKIDAILPAEHKGLSRRLGAILGAGEAGGSIQETFLAVRRLLEALATKEPVVAVFDDIQWGEGTFLDLIQYLVTFARGTPLFVLCLARPELLESRPDWGQTGEMIRLEPLDGDGAGAVVANLLGKDAPPEAAATIVQAAGGNPLFIEEMLRMLVDQGALVHRGTEWAVTGDLSDLGRPGTVHAVISARLDRLDDGERAVLQTAAIIGEVFWWSAVAELTEDATPIEVAQRLQSLVRKDLIRPDPSTFFSEDAFRFGHLLIRDVAHDSLPKKQRASVHERFARWVETTAGERASEYDEIIGYHAEQAYRYLVGLGRADERSSALAATAADHLASAGQRSFDRGDMPAAVSLLFRTAKLLPDEDARRVPVLGALAFALRENGRLDESEGTFAEQRDAARALGDRRAEMRAEVNLQFLRLLRSAEMSHGDFVVSVEPAYAFFREVGDDAGLSETLRCLGVVDVWKGRCEAALERFEEALAAAARADERRLALEVRRWMCLALEQGPTPAEEAIRRIHALLRDVETDTMFWWQTHRFLAELQGMQGRFDEARALVAEASDLAAEMGLEMDLAAGLLRASGEIAIRAGDLERAEGDLRRSVEILVRIGDMGHLASVAPDLARSILEQGGREAEALEVVELGDGASIEDDADAQVRLRAVRARILSRQGNVPEAETLARDALERAWNTDYPMLRGLALDALAEVLERSGRTEEAADALERAIGVYEAKGDIVSVEKDRRALAAVGATREAGH